MGRRTVGADMLSLTNMEIEDLDFPDELNSRQKRIVQYRMRGLTQKAIASVEGVTQGRISQEITRIKEIFAEAGKQIDQEVVVGETMHLYEEIKAKHWDLYRRAVAKENLAMASKSLDSVMTAHEKGLKLMMDLGLIKRAAIEHNHTVAPFLKKWEEQSEEDKKLTISTAIHAQLAPLASPEPPEYDEIIDVDVEEDDDIETEPPED